MDCCVKSTAQAAECCELMACVYWFSKLVANGIRKRSEASNIALLRSGRAEELGSGTDREDEL